MCIICNILNSCIGSYLNLVSYSITLTGTRTTLKMSLFLCYTLYHTITSICICFLFVVSGIREKTCFRMIGVGTDTQKSHRTIRNFSVLQFLMRSLHILETIYFPTDKMPVAEHFSIMLESKIALAFHVYHATSSFFWHYMLKCSSTGPNTLVGDCSYSKSQRFLCRLRASSQSTLMGLRIA